MIDCDMVSHETLKARYIEIMLREQQGNAQSSQEGYIKPGPLDEGASRRIEDLLLEASSGGEYLKIADGQSLELTIDVNESPGTQTRTINTKEGEKEITRFAFVVWNPQIKQRQLLELSNKWVKAALQTMIEYNTNTLVVKRTGSSMTDTAYTFLPPGLKRVS